MSHPSFGELGGEDPYVILGVAPDADEDAIREARRRLLRRYHPDMPGGDLARSQMVTAASHILLDPLRRRCYEDMHAELSREREFSGVASGGPTGRRRAGGGGPGRPGAGRSIFEEERPDDERPARSTPRTSATRTSGTGPSATGTSAAGPGAPAASSRPGSQEPPLEDDDPGAARSRRPSRSERLRERRRWSGLAVVAALSVFTLTPASLPLGVTALAQVRRTGRRGGSLAVFALMAGVLVTAAWLVILISAFDPVAGR